MKYRSSPAAFVGGLGAEDYSDSLRRGQLLELGHCHDLMFSVRIRIPGDLKMFRGFLRKTHRQESPADGEVRR